MRVLLVLYTPLHIMYLKWIVTSGQFLVCLISTWKHRS